MNSTEILEGNKLIANFLGWKTFSRYHSWKCKNVIQYDQSLLDEPYINENDGYLYEGSELFHSSWDWLMPVVEKIEHLYEDKHKLPLFEITSHNCNFALTHPMEFKQWIVGCFPESREKVKANSKIEAAWIVAVEFIKWFNKQQKQQ